MLKGTHWEFTYTVPPTLLMSTIYRTIVLLLKWGNWHCYSTIRKIMDFIWILPVFLLMSFFCPRIPHWICFSYLLSFSYFLKVLQFPLVFWDFETIKSTGQYFRGYLSILICLMISLWFCNFDKNNIGFMCVLTDLRPRAMMSMGSIMTDFNINHLCKVVSGGF